MRIKDKVACNCGKIIIVTDKREGRTKYCSKECFYKYRRRPTGLKYIVKQSNRSWFKKGFLPWNKDKVGVMAVPWNRGIKGIHLSPETEFKKGMIPWNKDNFNPYMNDRGYVSLGNRLLHRIIMENYLNRELLPTEVVHHINHIRNDNRIENLVVMLREKHTSFHWGKLRKEKQYALKR